MVVWVKDGVLFTKIAPGGFVILAAIQKAARLADLTITSACDGIHSGPNDPHPRGEAYDIRTHDLPDKHAVLADLIATLGETQFYTFLENEGLPGEHIHSQVRKGTVYPPTDAEYVQDVLTGL